MREELSRDRSQLAELGGLAGQTFEHKERYRELLRRQSELVDLLDLAKNQAAAQQATETTADDGVVAVAGPKQESETTTESASVSFRSRKTGRTNRARPTVESEAAAKSSVTPARPAALPGKIRLAV